VKNKVAAPFREVEVDILYGEGISRESDLLDLGVIHELVEKSGSWFSYAGERIGQGRENARTYLVANPEAREQLDAELRKKLGFDASGLGEAAPKPPASGQLPLNKAAQSA
jgi:recombination protein RecA